MNSICKECEICFENIFIKGKLNCCDHNFHYSCICRWSRISSSCPTCRKTYSDIYKEINAKIVKVISLNDLRWNEKISASEGEDWEVVCYVCSSARTNCLITCKGSFACPVAVHSYCLDFDVDVTRWMCSNCDTEFSDFSDMSQSSEQTDESFIDTKSEDVDENSDVLCWVPEDEELTKDIGAGSASKRGLAGSAYLSNLSTSNSTPSVIDLEEQDKQIILVDHTANGHETSDENICYARNSDFYCFGKEQLFTINEYLIEDHEGDFIKHQLINFDIPQKRSRIHPEISCEFHHALPLPQLSSDSFPHINNISDTSPSSSTLP